MVKLAIIIRGPAGAGKTTTSEGLKEALPHCVWINVDAFRHMISKDSSDMRRNIARNVGVYFLSEVIRNNLSVIIDEIFHDNYYSQINTQLTNAGYKVHTFFLSAPEEVLLERNNSRRIIMPEEAVKYFAKETKINEGDILIDTDKYSTDEIISKILGTLNK